MRLNDPLHIKKQRSLCHTLKAVGHIQCVSLRHPCDRKWLAGKAGQEQVMLGNIVNINPGDITCYFMITFMIGPVCLYGKSTPFTGKNILATELLKAKPHSPYPREKVNKAELRRGNRPKPVNPHVGWSFSLNSSIEGTTRMRLGQKILIDHFSAHQDGLMKQEIIDFCIEKRFENPSSIPSDVASWEQQAC